MAAKKASAKQTSAAGVLDDERQLLGGQAQVERVDDAAAEQAGVVELEEGVAVERHYREAVAAVDPELEAMPSASRHTRSRCSA